MSRVTLPDWSFISRRFSFFSCARTRGTGALHQPPGPVIQPGRSAPVALPLPCSGPQPPHEQRPEQHRDVQPWREAVTDTCCGPSQRMNTTQWHVSKQHDIVLEQHRQTSVMLGEKKVGVVPRHCICGCSESETFSEGRPTSWWSLRCYCTAVPCGQGVTWLCIGQVERSNESCTSQRHLPVPPRPRFQIKKVHNLRALLRKLIMT